MFTYRVLVLRKAVFASPHLFIATQTIIIYDDFQDLDLQAEPPYALTLDVLYANDPVLVSRYANHLCLLLD